MYPWSALEAYLKIESPNHGKFGKTVQLLQLYKYVSRYIWKWLICFQTKKLFETKVMNQTVMRYYISQTVRKHISINEFKQQQWNEIFYGQTKNDTIAEFRKTIFK